MKFEYLNAYNHALNFEMHGSDYISNLYGLYKPSKEAVELQNKLLHSSCADMNSRYLAQWLNEYGEAKLVGASLVRVNLAGANFSSLRIRGMFFSDCNLSGAIFDDCDLSYIVFGGLKCTDSIDLSNASFRNAKITSCLFSYQNLRDVDMTDTIQLGVNYQETDLGGAIFSLSRLEHCDFRGVYFDSGTRFERLRSLFKTKLNRDSLSWLDSNHGGLTPAMKSMTIDGDEYSVLKKEFSGYRKTLHILSIIAFLVPYLLFGLLLWVRAIGNEVQDNFIPLYSAVFRYALNDSDTGWYDGWKPNAFRCLTVLVYCSYAVVRMVLIQRLTKLEQEEKDNGYRASFYFTDEVLAKPSAAYRIGLLYNRRYRLRYAHVFIVYRILYLFAYVLVAINALTLLNMPIALQ